MDDSMPMSLLELPPNVLELLADFLADSRWLGTLRASCTTLKAIADRRIYALSLTVEDLHLHSLFLTAPLPKAYKVTISNSRNSRVTLNSSLLVAVRARLLPNLSELSITQCCWDVDTPASMRLDLRGLHSLSICGMGADRVSPARFPSGLTTALQHVQHTLTCLQLSYLTFEERDADSLECLTGLESLRVVRCSNHGAGLGCISALTHLTQLELSDIAYKVPIFRELVGMSTLTNMRQATFLACDFFPEEVMAWSSWSRLTHLTFSSIWAPTYNSLPALLPRLASLQHLDAPAHCFGAEDAPALRRLTALRCCWLDVDAGPADHSPGGGSGTGGSGCAPWVALCELKLCCPPEAANGDGDATKPVPWHAFPNLASLSIGRGVYCGAVLAAMRGVIAPGARLGCLRTLKLHAGLLSQAVVDATPALSSVSLSWQFGDKRNLSCLYMMRQQQPRWGVLRAGGWARVERLEVSTIEDWLALRHICPGVACLKLTLLLGVGGDLADGGYGAGPGRAHQSSHAQDADDARNAAGLQAVAATLAAARVRRLIVGRACLLVGLGADALGDALERVGVELELEMGLGGQAGRG